MCCYILSSIYLVDWTDPGLVLASGWRAGPLVMLILHQSRAPLAHHCGLRGGAGDMWGLQRGWEVTMNQVPVSQTYARSEYKDNPPLFV